MLISVLESLHSAAGCGTRSWDSRRLSWPTATADSNLLCPAVDPRCSTRAMRYTAAPDVTVSRVLYGGQEEKADDTLDGVREGSENVKGMRAPGARLPKALGHVTVSPDCRIGEIEGGWHSPPGEVDHTHRVVPVVIVVAAVQARLPASPAQRTRRRRAQWPHLPGAPCPLHPGHLGTRTTAPSAEFRRILETQIYIPTEIHTVRHIPILPFSRKACRIQMSNLACYSVEHCFTRVSMTFSP